MTEGGHRRNCGAAPGTGRVTGSAAAAAGDGRA